MINGVLHVFEIIVGRCFPSNIKEYVEKALFDYSGKKNTSPKSGEVPILLSRG